jgi:hypothetical protein
MLRVSLLFLRVSPFLVFVQDSAGNTQLPGGARRGLALAAA